MVIGQYGKTEDSEVFRCYKCKSTKLLEQKAFLAIMQTRVKRMYSTNIFLELFPTRVHGEKLASNDQYEENI